MPGNNSLEDLEEQYKESKEQSLTDLEDIYQEYKVLGAEEEFSAKISDACIDEDIYLEFLLTAQNRLVVEIEFTVDGLTKVYDIFKAVGQPFGSDLQLLVGEVVSVQFENEQMKRIYVGDRRNVKLDVLENPRNIELSEKTALPEEIIAATRRLVRYERNDDKIIQCNVTSAYPNDDRLMIEFGLLGETATWSTPIPDSQNMSGSTFESVVEKVGHGSVQQIAEGDLYVVGKKQLPVSLIEAPNLIGKFENWKNTWALFGNQTDAEECLELDLSSVTPQSTEQSVQGNSSAATQAEHHVPQEKVKAFLDTVQPSESIRYVGKGGPIEIERGGDTEIVTSMSGLERIAITNERVILKSSQVTGDVYYKLTYDELQGVDLKTGIINKKISLRTGYGTYHIKISDVDKEKCREMVDFTKEHIHQ